MPPTPAYAYADTGEVYEGIEPGFIPLTNMVAMPARSYDVVYPVAAAKSPGHEVLCGALKGVRLPSRKAVAGDDLLGRVHPHGKSAVEASTALGLES
jgi:hypothetical protein